MHSLRQIAMVYVDLRMPILLSYGFRARDVMDLFINLVSPVGLQDLAMHLLMRRFSLLWSNRGFHRA